MIETSSFIVLLYCKLLSVVLDCKIIYEHTISAKIGLGKKGFLLVTTCAYYLTVVGVWGGGGAAFGCCLLWRNLCLNEENTE